MKFIDLSKTISEDMSIYPGCDGPTLTRISDIESGDAFRLTKIEISTHTGTHLDCTTHVMKEGYYTDDKDINHFGGPGIVIDCRNYLNLEMGVDVLDGYDLEGKEFILFYGDYMKYWKTDKFWEGFPLFSEELLTYLGTKKGVKGIGFDFGTFDLVSDPNLSKHKHFLANDRTVVENLDHLDELLGKEFIFTAFPLKFEKGDGSPVRAVAMVN